MKAKYLIPIGLGFLTLTGAALYYQYLRLQDTCIKFGKIALNKLSMQNINFDLTLLLTNNTKFSFTIHSQKYDVYINNSLVSQIQNSVSQTLLPNTPSPVTVTVNANEADLKKVKIPLTDLISNRQNINLRIDVKLMVGILFIKLPISFSYNTNLKDLTSGSEGQTKSQGKC